MGEGICTFEEGGEIVKVDVLVFDAFDEVEKHLVWVLALGDAEEGRGGVRWVSYLVVVLGGPVLEVRLVGEVSFRVMVSVNDSWNECLCDNDAAESLAIVHERRSLAGLYSSVRSFAYNRHVGGIDCFAFKSCICGYVT